jgi:hypothetical protein
MIELTAKQEELLRDAMDDCNMDILLSRGKAEHNAAVDGIALITSGILGVVLYYTLRRRVCWWKRGVVGGIVGLMVALVARSFKR